MPTICPKCSYARKESDTCPQWQCPSCQVAYSKVGESHYAAGGGTGSTGSGFRAEREAPASQWKWLLILVVIVAVAWQGKSLWKRQPQVDAGALASQSQRQPEVVFYSASWCGYCNATRDFFKDNGIRYTEHDVENTAEGIDGYKNLGGGGIPIIVVGEETVRGFNESGLRKMLKPWIKNT